MLLSVGKGRQVMCKAQEGFPGESHQRFPTLLLGRTKLAMVGVNPLLCMYRGLWHWRFRFVTCNSASLQLFSSHMDTAAAPAFCAGFEAEQNMSVAEVGVRIKRDVVFGKR